MAKKKAPDSLPRPAASPEVEQKIREFQFFDNRVAELEEELSDMKARRKYIGEHEMVELVEPDVMETGVRLSDGSEWAFHQEYECGIRSDDKPTAYQYLREHDGAGMLKSKITISFGKDSQRMVREFKALLARLLPQYEVSVRVGTAPDTLPGAILQLLEYAGLTPFATVEEVTELPGATLRSWVIKQLKLGQSLPACFGVYAPLRAKQVTAGPS